MAQPRTCFSTLLSRRAPSIPRLYGEWMGDHDPTPRKLYPRIKNPTPATINTASIAHTNTRSGSRSTIRFPR